MEDLPISLLMQQEKAKPRTGEELETFGKHAANIYLSGQCKTLSEAVVESVKTAGLSPEQVRRVVEFTNQGAYLKKFASEGPNHKVINFKGGPASFPDVIRDLNDGGGGSVMDKAASAALDDYQLPPPSLVALESRNLERLGVMETKLAEAFASEDPAIPYADPLREAHDLRDKIAGLYNEAVSELSGLETMYLEVCDGLFNEVKQASLSGVPLGHVVAAMQAASSDPVFTKAAFSMLTPRLIRNEVFPSEVAISDSLSKFAGAGLVNEEHPLVGAYAAFCETLEKLAATREVRDQALAHVDVLSRFMSKAASTASSAAESLRSAAGHVPKVWRAATNLAAHASEPVSEFATGLGGETAGKITGGLVRYAPHIGAGLAAEEVYQRATNHPALQAAKNFAMARVPYTHQNMIRQYNMQMGM